MSTAVSTFTDDALGTMDTVALIEALANRTVSPAELRDAAVERGRIANEALNAVVCWVPDPMIGDGPFAGIPSFIKDNDELAGLPMRDGSRAMPAAPAQTSSEFAAQYQELGFTIVGKSTLPEFGLTASCE
ncbi:MAG: amidase family protein, partial [Actinomycetes bacterium]